MPTLGWIASLAILSLILAAIEHGWANLSRTRLAETSLGPAARARLESMLESGDRVENALIVLRVGVQITLIMLLVLLYEDLELLGSDGRFSPLVAAVMLAGVTSFIWITIFCRVIPGEMRVQRLEQLVRFTMPVVVPLSHVLSPVIEVLRRFVRRVTGHTSQSEAELYADEILNTLEEGAREGHLKGEQADMIESVLDLSDTEVCELMTPRTEMDFIDHDADVATAQAQVQRTGRSRYPIVEGTVDKIVGILHAKDLLGKEGTDPIAPLVREPWFVPESKFCTELLTEFRRDRKHLALVLDEYGGTAGLVTIEDVLEEIVGEIDDEFDPAQGEPELEILDERHAVAQGAMHVDELNEALSVHIPESDDWSTLGGFIFSTLGRLPTEGEEMKWSNLVFRVQSVVDRRIEKVSIEILEVAA